MDKGPRPERYHFAGFELEPGERRLLAAGAVVPITSRAFDLLVALVERAGELVEKDDLLSRVWPRLVVEESNLPVQVSTLRKLLGQRSIETVPGRGYRFRAEVTTAAGRRSPAARMGNVAPPLTRFVGPAHRVEDCVRLLEGTRLLTLTGIGGIGKTRLMQEVAEACSGAFDDGVWFLDVSLLSDATQLPQSLASCLGASTMGGTDPLLIVTHAVRERRLLLMLDTCEHLLAACAEFVKQLLQSSRWVKVLATSREPLRLAGETTFALDPLATPSPFEVAAPDALSRFESVRLFMDRARTAHPEFALTPANADAIARICRQLDGLPLAIELAASLVRVLSPEAIADRLGSRFDLLKDADPTADPRHRTLKATLDWSYALLTPEAQLLLRQLAVFAGGWPPAAAQAVCGRAAGIDADVLDGLAGLVDKSLVMFEPTRGRYRMLDTVREYVRTRDAADGQVDASRRRHLAWLAAWAETTGPDLVGPREATCNAQIDDERDNILAALAWCQGGGGDGAAALRLAFALRRWICRSALDLGRPILGGVLARMDVRPRDSVRCRGLFAAGFLSYYAGAYDDARRCAEESLVIARVHGDKVRRADALVLLASACLGLDDRSAARAHVADGLALAGAAGDPVVLWDALTTVAEIAAVDGDLERAQSTYEESLAVARALGARDFTVVALLNLVRIALAQRNATRAHASLAEAAALANEIGSTRNAHAILSHCAGLAALRADWEHAVRFASASDRQLERLALHREPADEAVLAPLRAHATQALGAGALAATAAAGRQLPCEEAVCEVRRWLATAG